MASYINTENQTILWNTIQKIQLLHQRISPHQQQEWFRQIIGMFYQKIQYTHFDLRQLNKDTIKYMIDALKEPMPNASREYKQPTFNEPVNDSVIENMDELLEQQLKQRELDITQPDIVEMRRSIRQLQEDVARLKLLITEPKEVTE
jgi:hypothetical protein